MLRAEIGDQLVGPGPTVAHGRIVGVVIGVHGADGGPPFTVRWYDDGHASRIDPDPGRYWVRAVRDTGEVGTAMRSDRSVA